jgi:Cep192 domain 4
MVLLAGCQGVHPGNSNGGAATLAASSSKLSFGKVQKSKSSSLSDAITNTGGSPVTVTEVNVSGAGFSVSGLSLPMTLSSNESVTFSVTFAPVGTGSAAGTLAILSTAANSILNVALSGTEAVQGQLSVSPASLSFGNVVVGANGTLNGTVEANRSSVTISSASSNCSEFVLSGLSLPMTLSDGQTASFTVTFNPATSGGASATLSFASDAAGSPTTETLTGKGVAATEHSVYLSWEASDGPDVVGYNIYRGSGSGGPYSRINSALEASTSYADTGVTAGATYYYATTAVDGSGGESGYSNQVRAVIPTP